MSKVLLLAVTVNHKVNHVVGQLVNAVLMRGRRSRSSSSSSYGFSSYGCCSLSLEGLLKSLGSKASHIPQSLQSIESRVEGKLLLFF